MFSADIDDTKLHTKFTEPITRQRLCQDVSKLLLSADVLNVHSPVSNTLSNKMKSNINVLASIVKDRILTEGDCRLAVHLQQEGGALLACQVSQELRQPGALACRRRPRDVLCFARGEGEQPSASVTARTQDRDQERTARL